MLLLGRFGRTIPPDARLSNRFISASSLSFRRCSISFARAFRRSNTGATGPSDDGVPGVPGVVGVLGVLGRVWLPRTVLAERKRDEEEVDAVLALDTVR